MKAGAEIGGISVRGESHVRSNMPNQDALAHARAEGWSFLAVADGHGSSRHHRSDRGAAFAVEAAIALLRSCAGDLGSGAAARVIPTLARDLVAAWRERVEADIRGFPVRERPGFDSHAVYGATCLAAAIGPGGALFLQIGDGDMLASGPEGEVGRAIPLDPRLVGPGTFSLCQPDAPDRVHVRFFAAPHPLSAPDFVMAATDGLSKSYRDDDLFLAVPRWIRQTLRATPLGDMLRDFEPWLAECSRLGSRDDATVALFSARSPRPEADSSRIGAGR